MFESIFNWLSGHSQIDCGPSHVDSSWSTTSSDSSVTTTSPTAMPEPEFQNAYGCGAEFIVPSEASSAFPSFELTEITYGSLPDDFTTRSDWDW